MFVVFKDQYHRRNIWFKKVETISADKRIIGNWNVSSSLYLYFDNNMNHSFTGSVIPKCVIMPFGRSIRSSQRRCSVRKDVLISFAKFTGLGPATLLKKRPWHRCFPANFAKFLRTRFLQNTSGRLSGTCPQTLASKKVFKIPKYLKTVRNKKLKINKKQ